MKNISFDNPYLLLVIIPAILLVIIPILIAIRRENRSKSVFISLGLHIVILVAVTLALAGMMYTTVMTETQVYVVADVSYSANANLERVDEYIKEIQANLPKNSKLGVVVFGKDYKLLCDLDTPFETVKDSGVNDSATEISGALDYTVGLFDEDVIKRIIVISDGKETHTDAAGKLLSAVENVYANDIYIDAIYLDDNLAEDAKEVQISDVDFAATTYMNHKATAEVLVQSSYDTEAIAVLYVEGERVENEAVTLTKGYNIISFDLPTGSTGRYDYRVAISAAGDACTSNNTYDFTQSIVGKLQVLLVSWDEADLERAQEIYGSGAVIDAYIKNPNVPCGVDELIKYDEILLSNFDVRELNNYSAFIDGIEQVVSRFGKSLVTMGDLQIQNKDDVILKDLENMLPVKFGNSDQDPKLYAIVLDTSRSMQNFSRLRIAKAAAVQLLNLLSDEDYVMVVTFWGEINVLQAPTKASNREEVAKLINSVQPYQGTVIGTALDKAGDLMIDMAFDEKQIMLISDGMSYTLESDTPADVVQKLHDNGITTSVIHPAAREDGFDTLKAIAAAGGGGYFEIERESDLMEIMFKDIADDLTDSVIKGQTAVNLERAQDDILAGIPSLPDIMGYTYAKAKASATTVLTVDFVKSSGNVVKVPLYAYWNYGNGRVSSYTSTFTGAWTEDWRGEAGSRFFENLVEVNVPAERLDYPYTIDVTYDGSYSELEIIPVTLNPYATTVVTVTMPDGTEVTEELAFDSTRYYHRFETPARGKYIIDITYSYSDKVFESEAVFNICYSPEYDRFAVFDPAALHAAIRNRGGVYEGVIPPLANDDKEVATYVVRFLPPLMIAAVALYVIDIMIRKLKLHDIKSFFGIKPKKGGRRV